jgi:DinB superfamily
MPDLSANRNSILEQLKQAEDAAERLLNGKSREQANWQPNQGTSWSMWQCFDHLARINRVYCQALLAAVENPRATRGGSPQTVVPGWFARWFIKSMEPPVSKRFKAPAEVIPTEAGNPQEALQAFLESHAPVRRVLDFWDRVNFDRVRFKNPFVPVIRFTVGTGLMVINAHDRRHLWQAQRVQDAPGFPKG